MPAARLSREDVVVSNLARRYDIDLDESATIAALREAYRAGLWDAPPQTPATPDQPNG